MPERRTGDELFLERVEDPAYARAILEGYDAPSTEQEATRSRIVTWIDEHPDALLRTCLAGHLTASAIAVDRPARRVLLHHHRKLDRWLQFGGHCDGDANLRACAWRETVEESGIEPVAISAAPVDLDIHDIPARPGEPEHLHLDTRYVIELPAGANPRRSEESLELAWFTPAEARGLDLDDSLHRMLDLVFGSARPETRHA